MKSVHKATEKSICSNKRARFDYALSEKVECGIVLTGWEVKSIRSSRVQINEAYVKIINNEAFLIGSNISPLSYSSTEDNIKLSSRTRKLLIHKKEIFHLHEKIKKDGFTLVPISLYWKENKIKLLIGLGKGKKKYDKRQALKEKDWKLQKERLTKKKY